VAGSHDDRHIFEEQSYRIFSLSDFKRSNLRLFVEKCSPNNNKKKNNNKLAMATMGSVPDPKS